ncbi:MAG TPA: F0F1 ATP synthase subunit epsilon [Actinotalea caeni]|uniref:F0F1 ATP synthase subunit epsilon n=1 Tax=Actinotalea caeni TaxID=1348467 RepID=UPI0012E1CB3D|nr:F0F1 ATP synthase subunit epsilon [Actinotalea caeni]HLV57217.1 F0F1 ATP synthase subunit epsilon [Actinotalea caeni]
MALNVEVVSPARVLWSGEASMVSAPAADGSMGVLPGHQPVLAVLRNGVVQVTPVQGEAVEIEVDGGFFSVDSDQVTIVLDASAAAHVDSIG